MIGKQNFPALTGLRAVAAAWVVMYHFSQQAFPQLGLSNLWVSRHGYLGVDIFFVLSGFVLAHTHGRNFPFLALRPMLHFYALRLARIYPAHLAVTLAFAAALAVGPLIGFNSDDHSRYSLPALLHHLTLMQAWEMSWNVPAWSISTEWLAYLFFPLLARAAFRLSTTAVISGLAALAICFPFAVVNLLDGDMNRVGVTRIALEFPAGMLLYRVCAACALWNLASLRFLGSPLRLRAVVYLGEISYSLYLVHGFAQATVGKLLSRLLSLPAHLSFALLSLASLVMAAALYHLIERPARNYMRRRLADPLELRPTLGML